MSTGKRFAKRTLNDMATYSFIEKTLLKTSPERAWEFFATPKNLHLITPPDLGFTSGLEDKPMYEGQQITYTLTVIGRPVTWVTRITHVETGTRFVDEQLRGPYAYWRHVHEFSNAADGVAMTDTITYSPPLGLLGRLANEVFIRRELQRIFAYRRARLQEIFNQSDL
jgi:ligand-binding SRPBCC domain-containing protein